MQSQHSQQRKIVARTVVKHPVLQARRLLVDACLDTRVCSANDGQVMFQNERSSIMMEMRLRGYLVALEEHRSGLDGMFLGDVASSNSKRPQGRLDCQEASRN